PLIGREGTLRTRGGSFAGRLARLVSLRLLPPGRIESPPPTPLPVPPPTPPQMLPRPGPRAFLPVSVQSSRASAAAENSRWLPGVLLPHPEVAPPALTVPARLVPTPGSESTKRPPVR